MKSFEDYASDNLKDNSILFSGPIILENKAYLRVTLQIRSAADFARQLNIHVNHLNRAVRETIGQTTTQVIAARILHEAKVLLRHSTWNISEVAYALGFSEVTHFNNFFKKHTEMSPTQFRQSY
ncbi:MAG: AraC family transcriptional regulator [Lewinellaceae bacterium]|nr:AraC family transcriptional regulator [Lewinellaceae bacterium]